MQHGRGAWSKDQDHYASFRRRPVSFTTQAAGPPRIGHANINVVFMHTMAKLPRERPDAVVTAVHRPPHATHPPGERFSVVSGDYERRPC